MPSLPRLAIGTVQEGADTQAILTALLDTLRRGGVQVQCFASRASLPGPWTSMAVTGLPVRFLDSWLMSPELCREFIFAASGADLAVVTGHFDRNLCDDSSGGSLSVLCDWLALPRLAVVDVTLINEHGLPRRPDVDAVLLDRAPRHGCVAGMITDIETLWGLPVVGALGEVESARLRLRGVAPGTPLPKDLCDYLSDDFLENWRPERFAHLVNGAMPLAVGVPENIHDLSAVKPTVAVAYDEAFFGYFPSTLDQLELLGAQVVDFSPLRDESLPPKTDIVYLGCGRPEAYANALSENHCMKAALRNHAARGGRIYGEVGGAAYLCQMLETPAGEMQRMCGILPAVARYQRERAAPEPVEITVTQGNWLAPPGTRLRGYRSGRWRLEALGCQRESPEKSCCQRDLVGCHCAVGSLVHFHFAALPRIFASFFRPPGGAVPILDPWRTAL